MKPFIGTAGWSIPSAQKHFFPLEGSHLEKYSAVFNSVEINSCFYREHKAETYRRWGETVPKDFRFSLKLLKYFTHEKGLTDAGDRLRSVLDTHFQLGETWGALLIQLPPKLPFDQRIAIRFFQRLRKTYHGPCFIEPRHISWSTEMPLLTLQEFAIDKVLADPEPCPVPLHYKIFPNQVYLRLHGSPEIYKSSYSREALQPLAKQIQRYVERKRNVWCVFDNTTYGCSIENAMEMQILLPTNYNDKVNSLKI